MWLIPYIRNVVNLYLQHSTLRFKCVQKIHSRISVLIKWMAFIIWKLFFPSSSANYEDLFLILKIKFCSQGLWQSSSQLSLRSQHLGIKGGIVSSGRALWNGRCSLTAPSEISAKMWALNCLIIVIFTLFNFLALFQTCGVASGELRPVCPVQERYWWLEGVQGREHTAQGRGWGCQGSSVRRRGGCGFIPFFT